ncbi:MAG TPA: hypothetical protein VFR08_00480 [Candidatus Angelobacter sp.]|nr:hypothetical protein [Candidatus Angelobacter sp.]
MTVLKTSQLPVLADGAAIRAVPAPAQSENRQAAHQWRGSGNFGVSSKFM